MNRLTVGSALLMLSSLLSIGCQHANTPAPPASTPVQGAAVAPESPKCSDCTPVTLENFARAESDLYFNNIAKRDGFAKFNHNRTPTPIDQQDIVRMNRDTLYSAAMFDLDAGPVTITLPDSGKRFMSMQVINEDHYAPMVVYAPSEVTLTKDKAGTRYVLAAVRTLVDPNDPKDVEQVHALQDAIRVSQPGGPGKFEVPKWDQASQKKIRDALLVLGASTDGFKHAFGTKEEVDPIAHLIGTAMGWGGNPEKDATYLAVTPTGNDGKTVYKLEVKDVPVDGFWSVTVYNAKGYFEKNKYNAYSLNNITAKKESDGSINIQFGGCDPPSPEDSGVAGGNVPNCLPIM